MLKGCLRGVWKSNLYLYLNESEFYILRMCNSFDKMLKVLFKEDSLYLFFRFRI